MEKYERIGVFTFLALVALLAALVAGRALTDKYDPTRNPSSVATLAPVSADLPVPDELTTTQPKSEWQPSSDFDPLDVKNIDVSNPTRARWRFELPPATLESVWDDSGLGIWCLQLGELKESGKTDEYKRMLEDANDFLAAKVPGCKITDVNDDGAHVRDEQGNIRVMSMTSAQETSVNEAVERYRRYKSSGRLAPELLPAVPPGYMPPATPQAH
ncbi:MAG: hypothetical protein KDB90_02235 [Planctomycetes bacterium]|nr:hypothetical protein [Planctomycetota bacterium]